MAILKCWVDQNSLYSTNVTWAKPPGSSAFDPHRWLQVRSRADFDDESIGVLAAPAPDLEELAARLASHYAFLSRLDERLAQAGPGDRPLVTAAIQALPGAQLAAATLW